MYTCRYLIGVYTDHPILVVLVERTEDQYELNNVIALLLVWLLLWLISPYLDNVDSLTVIFCLLSDPYRFDALFCKCYQHQKPNLNFYLESY